MYKTIFILNYEPYYHKIQYSKVYKHDTSAAFFGVAVGAFVVYLSLSTFGSGSPDLSDLTVFIWYLLILYLFIKYLYVLSNYENMFKLMVKFIKIFIYRYISK